MPENKDVHQESFIMTPAQIQELETKAYNKGQLDIIQKQVPGWAVPTQSETRIVDKKLKIGSIMQAVGNATLTRGGSESVAITWDAREGKKETTLDKGIQDIIKTKGLNATNLIEGGALIPDILINDFIDLLRPNCVIRQICPTPRPMPLGKLSIRRNTQDATAAWLTGETATISASTPQVALETMTAKKMGIIVPVSNDLLRYENEATMQLIQTAILKAAGILEDVTFIRGNGVLGSFKGIRYWTNSSNIFHETTAVTAATQRTDLVKLQTNLYSHNVPVTSGYYIMNPITLGGLRGQVNSLNMPAFPSLETGNTLLGFPVLTTTNIPSNLNVVGSSSNETEAYFVDADTLILAQTTTLMIEFFPNGVWSENGTLVSGISTDQSCYRLILEEDFMPRYDFGASIIDSVIW